MKLSSIFFIGWSKIPDLRAVLAWRLAGVVYVWWQESLHSPPAPFDEVGAEPLEQAFLALRRMKGDRPTVYWSAIALQLTYRMLPASASPVNSERLLQIAQELSTVWNQMTWDRVSFAQGTAQGSTLPQSDAPNWSLGVNLTKRLPELEKLNAFWQHCLAEAMPNGMIALRVSDAGLAWWLDFLGKGDGLWGDRLLLPALELPFLEGRSPDLRQAEPTAPQLSLNAKKIFAAQAAHARCCSLLRLADQEGLVRLATSSAETGRNPWAIAYPDPIPWMQDSQILWLTHPSERRLITQLLITFEILCPQPPSVLQVLRSADEIAQTFQQFYADCRIFGEVNTHTPELAQARLGLVGITRLVLHRLLGDGLNIVAPIEL